MTWVVTKKSDPDAVALANRHYSRVKYGKIGKMVGPPGRLLTFITPCKNAVWVTHWPYADLALDRMDTWRCTMFRNEGAGLSSDLIVEAMNLTAALWSERPRQGWVTVVDCDEVQSSNPGYCFKQAGWTLDRAWVPTRKSAHLIRLTHPAPADGGSYTRYTPEWEAWLERDMMPCS